MDIAGFFIKKLINIKTIGQNIMIRLNVGQKKEEKLIV